MPTSARRAVRSSVLPVLIAIALTITLSPMVAAPAQAAGLSAAVAQPDRSTPVSAVGSRAGALPAMEETQPAPVVWPQATAVEVDLPDASGAEPDALVRAGSLPVSVGRAADDTAVQGFAASDEVDRARVEVFGQDVAAAAGVRGVLLRVERADGGSGTAGVSLEVDTSGFASAVGGDWASRLRLVRLPGCVVSAPKAPDCSVIPTLLSTSRLDGDTLRLSAQVEAEQPAVLSSDPLALKMAQMDGLATDEGAVIAVMAAASSDTGDFTKTPFSASYQWQGGNSGGDFSWSYDFTVPPVPGDLTPDLGLSYSSGGVDGQTAAENVQPGFIGEGWNFGVGHIERSYRSCSDDTANSPHYTNATGDQCWRLPNARMVWGGKSTELIPDDVTGVWRAADGDGLKVEKITSDWHTADVMFSPGDFDGDAKKDVLYRRRSDGKLFMARGDGAGGWLMDGGSIQVGSFGSAGLIFSPGDFDGDGKPDVIWRKATDGTMWLVTGNGTGGWKNATSVQIGTFGSADIVFSPGDFDGDGKADVIWRKAADGTMWLIAGNGTGGWKTGSSVQIGTGFGGYDVLMSPGDFNGDGKADVIGRNATSKNMFMFRGNGTGGWITGSAEQISTGPASADIIFSGGDHDGDTKRDVLWRSSSTKDVFLLAGAGTVTGGWKTGNSVNTTAPVRVGTGDDEYWKVTTVEGTQYFFGRSKLPNWQPGKRETNSQWTAPVFANHAGEPCFNTAGFTSSWCQMAYRWNLDYVVDRHGNSMAYFYDTETTHTGLAGNASTIAAYDRGGWLEHIEYGMRAGQELASATPPAKVVFGTAERCLTSCWSGTAWTSNPNTANWPDTPWDIDCKAAPCTGNLSPTFWTSRRLASVTTQIWTGTGTSYDDVDRWDLGHSFPGTGTGLTSTPVLWLLNLTRTGKANDGSVALPSIGFSGVRMDQRADYDPNGGMSQPRKYRISTIDTETGGRITVDYSGTDPVCQFGGTFPEPDHNTRRCFAQYYKAPEDPKAGFSWWHKYVVDSVTETDQVGASPNVVHAYAYSTAGASTAVLWAHDDGPSTWSTPGTRRSWGDWRGYPTVTVTTGPVGNQSQSKYLYFRGLKNDYNDDQENRASTIINSLNETSPDDDNRAGFLHEKIDYASPGGQALTKTIYDPIAYQTAQRTLTTAWAIPTVHTAYINRTSKERGFTWIAATSSWRQTEKTSTYDGTYGLLTQLHDEGDTASGVDDDTCTRTWYTHNTAKYLIDFPNRTETVGVDCATQASFPNDAVSDTRYYYDGASSHGTAPTTGNVTKTEQVKSYTGSTANWITTSTAGHDSWGRITSSKDGNQRETTTQYPPHASGLTTTIKVTKPATGSTDHETTTTLDPAWGKVKAVSDENNKVTTGIYDALGRLTSVTKPGNSTGTPDTEYTYSITKSAPSWTRTRELGPNGNQISSYEIYDGLMRTRQVQSTAPDGKRVITDTAYDGRGLAAKNSTYYNASSGPSSTLVTSADTAVDRQTRFTYDGLGRQTAVETWSRNAFKWKTTNVYDGNSTAVVPPAGGTVTMDRVDARGKVVEKRQYGSGGLAAGVYDYTEYRYDKAGRLRTVIDPMKNAWTYDYDLLGRQTRSVDPDTGATDNVYDNAGQLLTTTDQRQVTLAYAYDALGRRTAIHEGSAGGFKRAEWVYDTVAKGQLTWSKRFDGINVYTNEIVGYDDGYRPTSTKITIPSAEGLLADTYTTSMTYKDNGAPATVVMPGIGGLPAETITTTYTEAGQPTTVKGDDDYLTSVAYHWDASVKQTLHGAAGKQVRQIYGYDEPTGRLTSAQLDTENQTTAGTFDDKFTTEYGYDNSGNINAIAGKTAGTRDQVECFEYDHLRRLTEAWTNSSWDCNVAEQDRPLGGAGADPYWRKWEFDQVGNRKTQTDKGTSGYTTWTYHVPAAKAPQPHTLSSVDATGPLATTPTRSFTHDAVGNMLTRQTETGVRQTLTWDEEGHLATITENGQTTSYLYDADGNRLISRAPSKTTLYLAGTELELMGTGAPLGTRYYTAAGKNVAVRNAAGLTWTAVDHVGTQQVQINAATLVAARRRTMPYGEKRGTQPTFVGTKGYVGGTSDDTGLTHLGAREYDPSIGRFISRDPVIDNQDPQQMHGYAYSNNSPITFSDPDGLRAEEVANGMMGALEAISYSNHKRAKTYKRMAKVRAARDKAWRTKIAEDKKAVKRAVAKDQALNEQYGVPVAQEETSALDTIDGWVSGAVDWVDDHAKDFKVAADVLSTLSSVVAFCPLPACMVASAGLGVLSAGAYALSGDSTTALKQLTATGVGLIPGLGLAKAAKSIEKVGPALTVTEKATLWATEQMFGVAVQTPFCGYNPIGGCG